MSGETAVFEGGVGRDWGMESAEATPMSRLGSASSPFKTGRDDAVREDAGRGDVFYTDGVTDVAADYAWVMAPTHAAPSLVSGRPWLILASTATHAVALALFLLLTPPPAPIAEPTETAVEIVQEKPPETKPPEAKTPEPPKQAKAEPEPAKPEPPKPEPPKREAAKPEPPKPEPAKLEPPRQEAARPEPTKPPPREAPKMAKAEPPKPSAADLAKQAEEAKALQAMRDELAALEAQKAELKAQSDALAAEAAADRQAAAEEEAAAAKAAAASAAGVKRALGPLPPSFEAVALPSEATEGEVAVTYEQQVFSQLAKAKKAGRHVASPGIAHVVFHIDGAGKLLDVTLDHPSGDAFLDGEAIAIVRRAAPFPAPPPGANRIFSASMRFRIDE
jgi:TonB family protein